MATKIKIRHFFPRSVMLLIAISVSLFLFASSAVREQVKKSQRSMGVNNEQLLLIKEIRSQMATLSMWQYTLRSTDENDRVVAQKEISATTNNLQSLTDSIQEVARIDRHYTNNLRIALNNLKEANRQIVVANSDYKPSILIDSLTVNYRALYEIASFHVNSIEEMQLASAKDAHEQRYIAIVHNLSWGFSGLVFVAVIMLLLLESRKRANKSRDAAEIYLSHLFSSMPTGLVGVNLLGNIERMNHVASTLAIAGSDTVFDAFPFLQKQQTAILQALEKREDISFEITERGETYLVQVFPLKEVGGAVLRIDTITAQHQLKEELSQTKKMNAIGQLAGGVAHDFNNMLGGIMNATELLKLGCSKEEETQFVDLIFNTTQRAAELTRKLLTFAKKSDHKNEQINLPDLLRSTVELLRHTLDKRIDIELNVSSQGMCILGDKGQIQNVFLNMGINAGQAMPHGGTLLLSAFEKEVVSNSCKTTELRPGRYVAIEITDSGCGINSEDIEHIFEPFFTTKGSGTGIGLASAFGTVDLMDGCISVESEVEKGTTFQVLLPLSEVAAVDVPSNSVPVHGKGTILVVDDELIMRRSLSLILQKLGYTVLLAENGLEGVETYREKRENIDLIILDMVMPVMRGDQALAKIRELDGEVPVVICSGYSHSDDMERAKKLHIQGTIPKPYQMTELSQLLASLI